MSRQLESRPGRREGVGQALVEFALAVPILFAIVFGLIDGARLVFAYNTVAQAAREATRLAAVQAGYIGATGGACTAPVCPTAAQFRTNVVAAANHMSVLVGPLSSVNTYIACSALGSAPTGSSWAGNDCTSGNVSGNVVSVRLAATLRPLTPVFAIPFPVLTLGASAAMAIP